MDINPISATSIPAEAYEAAFNIAGQRLAMFSDSFFMQRRRKKEAQRILAEAEAWPLARCVDLLPFVGQVANGHVSGLSDDGRLRFALAAVWLAPFPDSGLI